MGCSDDDKQRQIEFAKTMIASLQEKVLESAGMQSISADGLSVTFGTGKHSSLRSELMYWEKRLQQLQGSSYYKSIDLSSGL